MNESGNLQGIVFNIQSYAIHDGPGIRTTVFMKGCPLKCTWCQNPESQVRTPQLFFYRDRCTGCGECINVCPEKAIRIVNGKSSTDRRLCVGTGKCTEVCPNEARTIIGCSMNVEEVFPQVIADRMFYDRSGGGVTVSGGEPMSHPEFVKRLLIMCRNAGIHTALDTCGYARWEQLNDVLDAVDLVLFDLKHMDPIQHLKYTGVSNEIILENARNIHHQRSLPMLVRVPVVPGYNDSLENMNATARFVAEELDTGINVHLLPYHRLGETKYERLEKPGELAAIEPPAEEHMLELKRLFESLGLTVYIGG